MAAGLGASENTSGDGAAAFGVRREGVKGLNNQETPTG